MNNRYVTTHLDDILAPKTTSAPSAANLDPITGAFPPKAHRGSAVCDFFANRTKFRNKSLLAVNRLEETSLIHIFLPKLTRLQRHAGSNTQNSAKNRPR